MWDCLTEGVGEARWNYNNLKRDLLIIRLVDTYDTVRKSIYNKGRLNT